MSSERKVKVGRLRFSRQSRRSQELFVIAVVLLLVLVLLAVLATIWTMPSSGQEGGGTKVSLLLPPAVAVCGCCDLRARV